MATVNSSQVDEVQIFDVGEAMKQRDHLSGRVDMARSPNSFIAVFQTRPRGGETHIHQHPDSDQILFILDGELTVEGLSGKFVLNPNQGVLIPAGVHYGFTNTTERDVVFLTMRTESSGGRRVAYVANVPSDPVAYELRIRKTRWVHHREVAAKNDAMVQNRKTGGIRLSAADRAREDPGPNGSNAARAKITVEAAKLER